MNILFLSPEYPPLGSPASYQSYRIVKAYADAGFNVTVVAADEPTKRDTFHHLSEHKTNVGAVRIVRYPVGEARSQIVLRLSRFFRPYDIHMHYRLLRRAVEGVMAKQEFSALFSIADPFVTHKVALDLSLSRFKFKCFWYSDPIPISTPEYSYTYMRFAWRRRVCEHVSRRTLQIGDVIVTVSDEICRAILSLEPSHASKGMVIPHTFDPADWPVKIAPPKRHSSGRLVIAHSGALYWRRQPFELIAGIRLFQERRRDLKVQLILEGGIEPEIQRRLLSMDLTGVNVELPGKRTFTESMRTISAADVLCVLDVDIPKNIHLPSKLADYVGAQKPILYIGQANSPTVRAMTGHPAFECCGTPLEIANALDRLERKHDDTGFEKYQEVYSRFSLNEAYKPLIQRMIEKVC